MSFVDDPRIVKSESVSAIEQRIPSGPSSSRSCCSRSIRGASAGLGSLYPRNVGPRGSWRCSAILMGEASAEDEHDGAMPFIFWKIKGEGQPSAGGATTRPES